MRSPVAAEASLPVQLTRFVGRERELAEVRELLASTRLLTLTGAGGSGKTRLALEAAGCSGTPVAWIDLAPILNRELVPGHVAASLGVRQQEAGSTEASVLAALRERPMLLVLDNCEHLVDAAAALAATLLRGCPALRILATSREALGVAGEVAWLLPTLSLPPAEPRSAGELAGSEAVELFVARAREALPSFALDDENAGAVARICRRLDGLPLALELAAARVRVLAPQQIAERLHDRFRLLTSAARGGVPRHRTLQEVTDWSYQLLGDRDQRVLQRMSAFVGPFSLEAAEEVCSGDGVEAEEVLDRVAGLAARSLVVVETGPREARYRLLETVRQFARDRLREAGGEQRVLRRHAEFFLAQALQRERGVFAGGSDPAFLAWFDAELDQLRAAAEWFESSPDGADAGLRLAVTLEWFWFVRGRFAEGRRWLQAALRRGADAEPRSRGRALAAAGLLAFSQGDVAAQREAADAAVPLLREAGSPGDLSHALAVLGIARIQEGDHARGWELLDEAADLARSGDSPEVVTVLALHGSASAITGALERSLGAWQEAAAAARRRGMDHSELHLADGLARVAFLMGDRARARSRFLRTLEIRVADPWCTALAVRGGACLAVMDGEPTRAVHLLGAASAIRSRIAAPLRPDETGFEEALTSACRAGLNEGAFAAAWRHGSKLDAAQALELARPRSPIGASRGAAVPAPSRAPAADLEVRALGPLEIRLHGEPVEAELWSHARPRELLLFLLCHPQGRTREQIGIVFWPDASPAQVKNRFHVLLHRLRRSLGSGDFVVVEGDRYRVDPAREVRLDAAAFEREMSRLLREGVGDAEAVQRLEGALALYRGDFLEGESVGDWHLEIHDRLRRLYVDGLSALADAQILAGEPERAAATLDRLVRMEDLREEACRRLMQCLAEVGQRDQALRHYARLVATLRTELDAAPEPATDALAAALRDPEAAARRP